MSEAMPELGQQRAAEGMRGDRNFLWYACAAGRDPYCCPHPSRAAAVDKGRWLFGGAPFFVFEADRAALDLRLFHDDGFSVIERVFRLNVERFDPEVGFEPLLPEYANEALGDYLDWSLANWWAKHRPDLGSLRFATVRSVETIAEGEAA